MLNYELTDTAFKLKTDDHIDLEFLYDGSEITHVYLDGNEFNWNEDVLMGLYVKIDGKITNVNVARRAAQELIYAYTDEAKAEQDDSYGRHMRKECRQGKFV